MSNSSFLHTSEEAEIDNLLSERGSDGEPTIVAYPVGQEATDEEGDYFHFENGVFKVLFLFSVVALHCRVVTNICLCEE